MHKLPVCKIEKEYTVNKDVLSIEKETYKTQFVLYPNPAGKYIRILGIDNKANVIIFSIDGKKVFEGSTTNQQRIALPDIVSGLYFVNIEEMERRTISKLIIE